MGLLVLLLLVPLTLQSGYSANNALVKAELFPAHIRTLGVALPYAVGNTLLTVWGMVLVILMT